MKSLLLAATAVLAAATPAAKPLTPPDLIAAAAASAWRTIPAEDLLVIDLKSGTRIVIQLAPEFTPRHVDAVRRIAAAGWWNDGAAIIRVQDNYVTQWGSADDKKAPPAGIADDLPAEYDMPAIALVDVRKGDPYAKLTGYSGSGWPVASDGKRAWLPHCYGYVGVGRGLKPSTGDGTALYTVIGHAPRQLDRNIAVVGRVLAGVESLSSLPSGTGNLGFYDDPKQKVAIRSIRLASALPEAERPRWQYLLPASATFARYQRARENRELPFFERPAGGADICNVPVPVRRAP